MPSPEAVMLEEACGLIEQCLDYFENGDIMPKEFTLFEFLQRSDALFEKYNKKLKNKEKKLNKGK